MKSEAVDGADLREALAALRAEVARLGERVAATVNVNAGDAVQATQVLVKLE